MCDLNFNPRRFLVMIYMHAKIEVRGRLILKLDCKNGQTDTRPIAFNYLTRLQCWKITVPCDAGDVVLYERDSAQCTWWRGAETLSLHQ